MPQNAAGIRIDPPVSLPSASAGPPVVARLQAGVPEARGGDRYRPAGVAAERERGAAGGDRDRAAAGGAARDALRVPRVAARREVRVVGRDAPGELVRQRLADDD